MVIQRYLTNSSFHLPGVVDGVEHLLCSLFDTVNLFLAELGPWLCGTQDLCHSTASLSLRVREPAVKQQAAFFAPRRVGS